MIRLLYLVLFPLSCCASSLRAVGNVAIVARPTSLIHTPSTPVFIHATHLSCGAEQLGETISIRGGQFIKEGSARLPFEGKIQGKKAILEIGKAPIRSAGRYKCEIVTTNDEVVTGNLIVYLPPIIELEHDVEQDITMEPHTVLLKSKYVTRGTNLSLVCNSFGYPEPFVRWEKDGNPLDGDIEYNGHSIIIKNVIDSAIYSCHAENSFPLFVGGPSMPHQTTLRIPIIVQ